MTDLISSGQLFKNVGMPAIDPAQDRIMPCGSPQVIVDVRAMLGARGLLEGSNSRPAQFVAERAFSEK